MVSVQMPSVPSNEPPHDKTNKITVRPAISLIRVFAVRSMLAKDSSFPHVDSEDTDQSGQMRMIWVFAGCTCHFVGFVMMRLKWILAN